MDTLYVLVSKDISEIHRLVDQNAMLILIVTETRLAAIKNALTLVWVFVELELIARLSIIIRSASVLRDILETHQHAAVQYVSN